MYQEILRQPPGQTINFITGKNGIGKSRLLGDICKSLINEKIPTIAISNTPNHRFNHPRNTKEYHRLVAGMPGLNDPSRIITKFILDDSEQNYSRMRSLCQVFNYLEFDTNLRYGLISVEHDKIISPKEISLILKNNEDHANLLESLYSTRKYIEKYSDIEALNSLEHIDYLQKNYPLLYDLDISESFDLRAKNLIKLLSTTASRSKRLLKLAYYIKQKSTDTYCHIDEISSGQKSLITTLSFISRHITNNGFILIDEPENSLHPQWQKEYCNNILNLLAIFRQKL